MRTAFAALAKHIAPVTVVLFLALQGSDRTVQAAWLALTLGSIVAAWLGAIDLQRPLSRLETGFAATLLAMLASAVFGVDPRRSLLLSVPMLASVLLWILVVRRRGDDRYILAAAAAGLGLTALTQSTLLVLAVLRHPQLSAADWIIDSGAAWLIVPNDLAWIACCLPLMASLWPRRSLFALALLLLTFLGLCLLVRSRSAALVALVVAACFVGANAAPAAALRRARGAVAACAAATGLLAWLAFGAASMRARLQLWQAAWAVFLDHPWSGVGIHNFVLVYRHYLPAQGDVIDPRITPWPHDLILEIAAECGLIALIPAGFLAGLLCRRWIALARTTARAEHAAILAGLPGLALLGLVEASLLRQWLWLSGIALCALFAVVSGGDEGKQE